MEHWAVMSVQPLADSVPARPSLPVETASKPLGPRRHVHAHARGHLGGVEPRAHGVDELHRVGVVGGKPRRDRGGEAPVQVVGDRGIGGLLPCGGTVLQHVLGDLGGRGLRLDGDGAAADQGHDRRGSGLALGDGVVVGDDEPVAAGQLGRRARVKGHGRGACFDNRAGKLCRQHGRHAPVGIHPFGCLLCRRSRAIKPRIMKHRENGLANGVICPRYVSCNLLVGIGVVDNGRRKESIRVIPRRNCTVHRNGSGVGGAGRPRGNRQRKDGGHDHHRDGQHMAERLTHCDHLDQDRDGGVHASMSPRSTASKRQPDTS